MKTIDLSKNNIKIIDNNTIKNLKNLVSFKANNNKINLLKEIPESNYLQTLEFNNNNITGNGLPSLLVSPNIE